MLRGFMVFPDLLMTFALTSFPLGTGVDHHILMDFFLESEKRKEEVSGEWSLFVIDNDKLCCSTGAC